MFLEREYNKLYSSVYVLEIYIINVAKLHFLTFTLHRP